MTISIWQKIYTEHLFSDSDSADLERSAERYAELCEEAVRKYCEDNALNAEIDFRVIHNVFGVGSELHVDDPDHYESPHYLAIEDILATIFNGDTWYVAAAVTNTFQGAKR